MRAGYGYDPTLRGRLQGRLKPDPSGCLLWTGACDDKGYGRVGVRGEDGKIRSGLVHIAAWELERGPVPDGLELDHVEDRGCLYRNCANLEHLEPVTHRVNMLRGDTFAAINASKTHCPADHEYTPENTYTDKHGRRLCRACNRARQRQWRIDHPGYFRPYDQRRDRRKGGSHAEQQQQLR